MPYNDERSPSRPYPYISKGGREEMSPPGLDQPRSPRMVRELAEDRRINGYVHDGFHRTDITADEVGATQEKGDFNVARSDPSPLISDPGLHYGETLPEATYRAPSDEEEEGPWKAS